MRQGVRNLIKHENKKTDKFRYHYNGDGGVYFFHQKTLELIGKVKGFIKPFEKEYLKLL